MLCALRAPAARADDDYQLGHGLDLGPFNFAGYSNLVAGFPEGEQKSLALGDLSLFVSGHFGRFFNPFTEAELANLNIVSSGAPGRDRGDGDLVLERLYNDSYLTPSTTLRLGKMLTPVGEWIDPAEKAIVRLTLEAWVVRFQHGEVVSNLWHQATT